MTQILDMLTTLSSDNVSTCGFFSWKGRCAQGFRNLPHTSGERFRKCGVKPRSGNQTPISPFRNLRFCCRNSVYARRFPILPRTSEITTPHRGFQQQRRHPQQHPVAAETSKGRCRKPNNDPSLSPPHVESTATVSLRTSYSKSINPTGR